MNVTWLSWLFVGLIIGGLGRLVVPGRQNIKIWVTLLIGVIAALIGSAIGNAVGVGTFLTIIIQVVLAAIGVAAVVSMSGRSAVR